MQSVTVPALATPGQRALTVAGVGYSATATHTCPDLRVTLRYRVEGGGLVAARATVTRATGRGAALVARDMGGWDVGSLTSHKPSPWTASAAYVRPLLVADTTCKLSAHSTRLAVLTVA